MTVISANENHSVSTCMGGHLPPMQVETEWMENPPCQSYCVVVMSLIITILRIRSPNHFYLIF